ncbi:MAG: RNA methyltransferase [Bacteroidetes bacterium]|jgi:TrmH family RNA methyltransferase|nr:RNA methyltransferase [Bacteroidota bacterium]
MPLSKNDIKYIKSLRQKKFRQKYNNFVVEGDKIVRELLEQRPDWIEALYGLDKWIHELPPSPITATAISQRELQQASLLKTPNQAIAVVRQPKANWHGLDLERQLSLYLENLQDPGNMGTILRIADWFGIETVLCSPNCVDVYNPKVLQASMGAFLRVHIATVSIKEVKKAYPALPLLATTMDGANVFEFDAPKAALVAVGNEGAGLSEDLLALADRRIAVPPNRNSGTESLNAAVATGIVCAVLRQAGL